MLMVNIADAKARLSEYIEAAALGERVLICNRNTPVAELRAVEQAPAAARDLTPMYPGHTFMTDAFLQPMTAAELAEWHDGPVLPAAAAPTQAAKAPAPYRKAAVRRHRKKTRRT